MPVLDEATFSGRRASSLPATVSTSNGPSFNIPNGNARPAAAPLVDLLDLSDDGPATSSSGRDFLHDLLGDLSTRSTQSGAAPAPRAGSDALLDLLSIGESLPVQHTSSTTDILSSGANVNTSTASIDVLASPNPPSVQTTTAAAPMMDLLDGFGPSPPKSEDNGSVYPSIVAHESSSLRITFNFSKPSGNPQTAVINASFTNLSPEVYTDFVFQAAVPKFLQLHLDPASGNTLPASGDGSITQTLKVTNSQHGKKTLVMRIRIAYKRNGKDVLEEGQVNNFPRGL